MQIELLKKLRLPTLLSFGSVVLFSVPAFAAADLAGGFVVDLVLLILVLMSAAVWIVAVYRLLVIRKLARRNSTFRDFFWSNPNLRRIAQEANEIGNVPFARLFDAAHRTVRMQRRIGQSDSVALEHAVERVLAAEMEQVSTDLEAGSGYLATTASSAPFIGLFGTVWGILKSFQAIGQLQSASLSVVAPGLSEALIATAVGLVAAIPAAVFYNIVLRKIEEVRVSCVVFSAELTNILATMQATEGDDGLQ